MSHSYRDARRREQHFHKHREGRLLMPHRCHTGLLFTVNPRQEAKAAREAQLFLSNLMRDLEQQAQQLTQATQNSTREAGEEVHEEEGTNTVTRNDEVVGSPSTSALLAAELAAATASGPAHANHKRPRDLAATTTTDMNTTDDTEERKAHTVKERGGQWGSVLETNCKGYLFVNIPSIAPETSCYPVFASPSAERAEDGEKKEKFNEAEDGTTALVPTIRSQGHLITRINPLVAILTRRIFDDLRQHPRPVFRNCFRLIPCELTCCPTLPAMQLALRALLNAHFPPASTQSDTKDEDTPRMTNASEPEVFDFTRPLPMSLGADVHKEEEREEEGAGLASRAKSRTGRSMHTIALQFVVKNNSNVEGKRALWQEALRSVVPVNRFILVPPHRIQSAKHTALTKAEHTNETSNNNNNKLVQGDAMVCVTVLHATCCMGLQRDYAARNDYNVHAMSEAALDLTSSVTRE